jgi:hypothetical protein
VRVAQPTRRNPPWRAGVLRSRYGEWTVSPVCGPPGIGCDDIGRAPLRRGCRVGRLLCKEGNEPAPEGRHDQLHGLIGAGIPATPCILPDRAVGRKSGEKVPERSDSLAFRPGLCRRTRRKVSRNAAAAHGAGSRARSAVGARHATGNEGCRRNSASAPLHRPRRGNRTRSVSQPQFA